MSKTCQVWYQIKGFDKYNLIKPDLKAFVVIWVKCQGQSRSGPKNKVKIQNCQKYVKFGIKLKGLTNTMQINKTKFVIFQKVISGFKIRLKEEVYQRIYLLTLFCIFTTHKLIKRLHDSYRF